MKTFFEHQHLARRNSRIMVLLFLLAVVGVVLAVDLVLAGAYLWSAGEFHRPGAERIGLLAGLRQVPLTVYLWGAVGTAALIFAVSAVNVVKLASGGEAVASMVGARRVRPDTQDPLERRFLNVVEEMAIASGVRVPAAYVMDGEAGINAFAAGWEISGSVVAVTRGTLQTLTRDELQGVIAHEFSHILNGDMRLNVRMLGVLAGIVFIGSIGEFIMRSVRGSNSKNSAPAIVVGLGLFIVGFAGLFFARLIKAAVSRQREFLADASSVQFTRNPDAIAGALDQIRSTGAGARISGRYAEDLSHMFFGQSVKMWFGGLFDTHPSVDERIRRAHPRFQAKAYRESRAARVAAAEPIAAQAQARPAGRRSADAGVAWGRSAVLSAALVGTLDAGKIDYAQRLLGSLAPPLRDALHDPLAAGAAVVALMLAPKDEALRPQLEALRSAGLVAVAARAEELLEHTRNLGSELRLPLVDLALPALKSASAESRVELLTALEKVIYADRRVTLHEFVVLTLVREQVAPSGKPGAAGTKKLAEVPEAALALLTIMARAGTRPDVKGERQLALEAAIRAGLSEMGLTPLASLAAGTVTLDSAVQTLQVLKALAPLQKALLIRGLFATVTADGTIRVAEAELMRLVGAVMDCPLPPLLGALDPASLAA